MKILAVDDDTIALDLLKESLAYLGYTDVQFCESAAEALDIVLTEKKPFDCFLFDIQMPGMNGIDLCQEVRTIKRYRRTPVIMVTAMSEKTYVDRAFAAGATDYITKPFDVLEMNARLGLAKELTNERKLLDESNGVIKSLITVLDETTSHRLDEAIELNHLDRVISYPAFENYLFQQTRGALFLSSIFAAKVAEVEMLHAHLPPLEFKEFLTHAAAAIAHRLDGHGLFLAYRGNGIFVGVMKRSGAKVLKSFTTGIRMSVPDCDEPQAEQAPKVAHLIFGEPVVSKIFARRGLLTVLYSAIENVQAKQMVEPSELATNFQVSPKDSSQAYRREKRRDEQRMRREYEELLQEGPKGDLYQIQQEMRR